MTAAKVGTISRDFFTNQPREQDMVITIDLTWKDLRTGKILMQRHGMQEEGVFHPPLGEGEFVGAQQAIERFALDIVHEMQADW